MGGAKTTTTAEASPWDVARSKAAMQLLPIFTNAMASQYYGTPTSQQVGAMGFAQQNLREQAGKMGVQPGSPALTKGLETLGESITKGNPDILQQMVQFFATSPSAGGKQTTKQTAGAMGSMSSIAAMMLPLALLFPEVAPLLGLGKAPAAATTMMV